MAGEERDQDVDYSANQPPSLGGVYERSQSSLGHHKREVINYQSSVHEDTLTMEHQETDGRLRSITNQLAETAVGVREMSKQLVRARIHSDIQSVLIITKARDHRLVELTREMAVWLMTKHVNNRGRGLIVYVDSQLKDSKRFNANLIREQHPEIFEPISMKQTKQTSSAKDNDRFKHNEGQLRYWNADMCSSSPHLFDFVITLGGDGTVLFCSWLFQSNVPPVIPFSLGSLGFLTPFNFDNYQSSLTSALQNGVRISMRMRFCATVYRAIPSSDPSASRYMRRAIKSSDTGEIIMRNIQEDGWKAIEVGPTARDTDDEPGCHIPQKDRPVRCFGTRPVESFEILNDLVVDRGPSPYVSMLEVFADNNHLTTAQADGLCVSTPTGSTAYSLSAGGSLVYPDIPAILITPICPHTLSFRPMLLPDSMELRIAVPYHSRSNAWASFDGRGRIEINRGDHIKITASQYPFPTVCPEDQPYPWFDSVSRTLNWNQRQKQKSFVMVEEHASDHPERKTELSARGEPSQAGSKQASPEEEASKPSCENLDSDTESDSAQDYDIDDRSSAAVTRTNTMDRSLNEAASTSEAGAMRRELHAAVQPMTSLAPTTQKSMQESSTPNSISTPDRYGSAGPPEAPGPLSGRHLAAANFRLQELEQSQKHNTYKHKHQDSRQAADSRERGKSERAQRQSWHSQAFVVYGHDDSDESDSLDV
ncbi:NAD(+) kinase [Malassezia yamatoensis]|uniref:NAD(+) kinase n=1 Tax=Malassezia yamatoensis TaxID=253288 RepID=A0AAJ6CFR1_9BASI|nr:NAD(+) kinase [Malassezia yamatoensis]